jgi:hypothetical protein
MSACLFSLTDRNFFQSGIFLPSMTWNTFVWAVTLVRRSLSADYTRMILQAVHADKRLKELGKQGRIIIKTSDTDVIALCI